MPLSAQPPSGILAARAHGIGGKCTTATSTADEALKQTQEDGSTQLILTIDYSRAALTALVVAEECGIFEYRRVLHDTSPGAEGLSRGSDSSHRDLNHALRAVTILPFKDGNGAGLKRISQPILVGESTDDRRLHEALSEVLLEHSSSLVTSITDERARTVDPLFAAARGVAQDCWDRMNCPHDYESYDAP